MALQVVHTFQLLWTLGVDGAELEIGLAWCYWF